MYGGVTITGVTTHYRNLSLSDRVIEGLDTVLLLGGMVTGYNRNGLFSATI